MNKSIKFILILVYYYIIFGSIFFVNDIFKIQINFWKNIYLKLSSENLFKETSVENLKNDYNFKFLPDTQFIKLNLKSKKLIFSENLYWSY